MMHNKCCRFITNARRQGVLRSHYMNHTEAVVDWCPMSHHVNALWHAWCPVHYTVTIVLILITLQIVYDTWCQPYLQHCDVTYYVFGVTFRGKHRPRSRCLPCQFMRLSTFQQQVLSHPWLACSGLLKASWFLQRKALPTYWYSSLNFHIASSRSHFLDSGIRNNVRYCVCHQAYFQDRKYESTPGGWLVHDYSAVGCEWDFEMVGILSGQVIIHPAVFAVIPYFLFSFSPENQTGVRSP